MNRIQDSLLLSEFAKIALRLAADSWNRIVLIHGLQGHPYKTWARKVSYQDMPLAASSSFETAGVHDGSRKYHRVVPEFPDKSSGPSKTGPNSNQEGCGKSKGAGDVKRNKVFWPKDLLPIQYPNARILVYGYDSNVSKFMSGPTNENSIHSHGKDLLFSLAASHKLDSRLILIAHSLGGVVVKEMLANSVSSTEDRLRNIASSTEAVIFLGTPHRGSHDFAKVGDVARRIISAFGIKTHEGILNSLGLKTTDLERAQESFFSVWDQYKFSVKTFQEGLGLTRVNVGLLGKKVVPDESSLLGGFRERAETIQANHTEMCRFTGSDDPNYARICGEITSICNRLAGLGVTTSHRVDKHPLTAETLVTPSHERGIGVMSEREKACLQSLVFPNMNQRVQNLEDPTEGTCSWFFKHESFVDWLTDKNQAEYCGLLWISGKPGSGKSTLVKEAFFRATVEMNSSGCQVISFFFNAKGEGLEHSPTGMLRSIIHQMCSQDPNLLAAVLKFAQKRRALRGEDMAPWEGAELKACFKSVIIGQMKRWIIFIDAIDECDSNSARDVADFWRETTKTAHRAGVHLSVCLSSRHFPAITVNDCPEIIVEDHNYPDIVEFVRRRLELGMSGTPEDRKAIQQKILERSGGVFLWVSLVVKDVLRKRDEGRRLKSLLKDLDSVPQELEDLFRQLLTTENFSEVAIKLFQWALLPAKPLRLHEWHHVLAFLGETPPSSLHEWRQSDNYTETDEQLEKRITHLSRGLLGFNTRFDNGQEPTDETFSDRAGAGSLDLNTGETRVVFVIHESVRQFFMDGPGFAVLNPAFAEKPLAHAHLSMMRVCLDYVLIRELDALVEARTRPERQIVNPGRSHDVRPYSYTEAESYFGKFVASLPDATFAPPIDIPYGTRRSRPPSRPDSRASVASFGSASSHGGGHKPLAFEPDDPFRDTIIENDKSTKRLRLTESPSPAPLGWRKKDDEPSVFEELKESSGPIEAYDVGNWISQDIHVTQQACYDEAATGQSPQVSAAGCSEVLEDYPALLSYATFELFTHAKKADEENLDPSHIIQLFRSHRLRRWKRWKALREDVDRCIGMFDLVADLGLSSWLKAEGVWTRGHIFPAMRRAIRHDHTRALRHLLDAFPSIGYGRVGGSLARLSASTTDVAALRAYISQYPSETPSSTNKIKALREILDSKDWDGRTSLQLAVSQQNKAAVLLLLKHGADLSAVDDMLRTSLHIACMPKSRFAYDPLSDNRTKADVLTPCLDIIESLLDHDAEIDAVDKQGRTPLMMACSDNALTLPQDMGEDRPSTGSQSGGGCFKAVELLLKRGANATKRDTMGLLPLHEACWNISDRCQSKLSIVSKLLDHGSPVNAKADGGGTPLHIACCCSDVAVVEELLRRSADPLLQDESGRSPLHIAIGRSSEQPSFLETFGDSMESSFPGTKESSFPEAMEPSFFEAMESSFPGPMVSSLPEAMEPSFFGARESSFPELFGDPTQNFSFSPPRLDFDFHVPQMAEQTNPTILIIGRLLAHGAKAYTIYDLSGKSPADIARTFGFQQALKLMEEKSCDAPPRASPERNDLCD